MYRLAQECYLGYGGIPTKPQDQGDYLGAAEKGYRPTLGEIWGRERWGK